MPIEAAVRQADLLHEVGNADAVESSLAESRAAASTGMRAAAREQKLKDTIAQLLEIGLAHAPSA